MADPNAFASQIQALQALSQQLGPDGLKNLLQTLGFPAAPQPVAPSQSVAPVQQQQAPASYAQNSPYPANGSYPPQSGAPQNGNPYGRDDQGYNQRARSRSPDYKRRRFSPPNRRESPTYGTYDPHAAVSDSNHNSDDRGKRGRKGVRNDRNDFRQRTPPSGRGQHEDFAIQASQQPKPIAYDNKLPNGKIKGNGLCSNPSLIALTVV
jgi:protein NRD1